MHVAVDDLEQSVRFYATLFAADPTVLKPDYAKWMLEDPRVKRQIPILVLDDGKPMLESMDMVRTVERLGPPVLTRPERPDIPGWEERVTPKAARLTQPRYPLLGLPEFARVAAHDRYTMRKRRTLGDLVELRAQTRTFIKDLMPDLEALDRMIESPRTVNGEISLDDVRVLPLLRSLAVVAGLRFPSRVRDYYEAMMDRVGYRPLPAV